MSPNPRLYARQRRGSRNRSDPRGLLGLLLFAGVPLCSYGGRLGAAECDLCSGETSDFPGLCAAGLSRSIAKNLSPDLRIELCKGARSDVRCRKRCLHFAFVKRCGLQLDSFLCRASSLLLNSVLLSFNIQCVAKSPPTCTQLNQVACQGHSKQLRMDQPVWSMPFYIDTSCQPPCCDPSPPSSYPLENISSSIRHQPNARSIQSTPNENPN